MRVLLLLCCFLLLGASSEKFELTGVVIAAGASAYTPVEGAEVRIEGLERVSRTDSAGSFKFPDLAPGVYRVTARKDGAEARGSVSVNRYAPPAMALVMVPAGTTMHGLTPLRKGTVYVGLAAREGFSSASSDGLDTTMNLPAKIINDWAEFMRLHGELDFKEFSRQTPVTALANAFMLLPPDNLPVTGYASVRDYSPVWLAFRPDGKRLYAACSDRLIRWYDPAVMKAQGSIATPDSILTDLACSDRFVAATLMSPSQPGVLVASDTERKVHEVPVGQPQSLCFAPDGMLLVCGDASLVARLDPLSGKVVGTGQTGAKPNSVAVSGDRVYVANLGSGDLSVLTYPDLKPAGRVAVGTSPRRVAVMGDRIFVSLFGSSTVAVLDANGPVVVGTPSVGEGPVGLATDGSLVYVACRVAGTVCALDASGNVVFTTSPQPASAPFGLAVHP
jgi:YVTN family beta-propeller protein